MNQNYFGGVKVGFEQTYSICIGYRVDQAHFVCVLVGVDQIYFHSALFYLLFFYLLALGPVDLHGY